jgi:hypothetical protein
MEIGLVLRSSAMTHKSECRPQKLGTENLRILSIIFARIEEYIWVANSIYTIESLAHICDVRIVVFQFVKDFLSRNSAAKTCDFV